MRIAELQRESHRIAREKGWWDTGRNVAEMLALAHSEISEALEEWRAGHDLAEIRFTDGKPEGFSVELADVFIRLADLAEALGIDLEHAIEVKMGYNVTRPYRHGGKMG